MLSLNKNKYVEYKNDLIYGIKGSVPICIGYVPLGIACGILSQKAGLTPFQIGIFSMVVYAGSGQFITASMLISHASAISIIFTTFIINLRLLLMSSALAPFFRNCKKRFLCLFAHEITDETFAINLMKFNNGTWSPEKAMFLNNICHFTWIISNIIGGTLGTFFNFDSIIVNFVLTSMFICLLCLSLKRGIYILCAILAGFIAVVLSLIIKSSLYIIIATLISATICYFIDEFLNKGKEGTTNED